MGEKVEVVVVGAGLAGLAAAALVARAGLSCVVLERAGHVGGRAVTKQREGFAMNLGGHALYLKGAAERVLHELGVKYTGAPPATGRGFAMLAGESFALPTALPSLLRTGLLGARGKLDLGRVLARLPRLDVDALEGVSLTDWLASEVRDPRARLTLEMFARLATYANAPGLASAGSTLRQLRQASEAGVLYLDGGWQTLVDGLEATAVRAGARIVRGAVVEKVTANEDGWTVSVRGGEQTSGSARSVLLAVGPETAHKMVQGPSKSALEAWAHAATPARAACLDLGLSTWPVAATTFALGVDRPFYFSVHSKVAKLAPGGATLVHAMKYKAPDDTTDAHALEKELEAFVEGCQPGWRGAVVTKQFLPDMVASHAIPKADTGGLRGRPGPKVPGVEGLFVAGDWVGAEGMLADASFASAADAARVMCANANANANATAKRHHERAAE